MSNDEFSKMLMDTQAKYLQIEGKHLTNISRSGQLIALYAVGKRFYEIIYSYPSREVIKVEEINAEQVMKDYLDQL